MEIINWITDIPGLVKPNLPFLIRGMYVTLKITLCAVVVGIVWGTILAIMRLSSNCIMRKFSKIYVNTFRSIPLLLVLLWFYLAFPSMIKFVFNLSINADIRLISAIIAFSLFEASYYSEIIRAGIQSISKGQYNAALALGMTHYQTMKLVILPQAFRIMIPLLLTQGIILFQDTSLIYVMSLMDFFGASMNIGKTASGDAEISMALFAGSIYFVICFIASMFVRYYKKRIQ